jgi:hypothetical protein
MIHNSTTTTLHHFDSAKWKKRLFNISHKLHRSHNNNHWNAAATSATAMAAATEKFVRHSSPTTTYNHHQTAPSSPRPRSDDIAIHSEDLTASQFANLTGIKTKRNSQQHSIYYPTSDVYEESSSDDEDYDDDEEEDPRDYYYSSTTSAASSSNRHSHQHPAAMRIWDSHFWQDGRKSLPIPILTSTTSMKELAAGPSNKITSQPLSTHISEPGRFMRAPAPSVVQKGRFKIVWGGQEEDSQQEPIIKHEPHCVEWKRKRVGSNSSTGSTNAN